MINADADIWVDFMKKPNSPVASATRELLANDRLAISGVVLAEVLRGLRDASGRFRDLLDAVPFLEMRKETWAAAAKIAADLDSAGITIPITDACIAAVSIEHDCDLFTRDKHFERIPGLRLYDPDKEASDA